VHDSFTTKGIHKPNDLEVVKFFIHTWGATWLRHHLAPLPGHDSVELMWIEPALKYEWRKGSKDGEKRGSAYGTETASVYEP
jgi:hypothetical protein